MKKTRRRALYIIAALLAALFVLSCLVGFAACGDSGEDDEKKEEQVTPGGDDDDENDNNDDDQKKEEVTDCGDGNHNVESWNVTKAADCGNAGSQTGTCTVCGKTVTETIPATGEHNWVAGETTATCTGAGKTTYTCSVCEQTKTEDEAALGHDWVSGTPVAATCTTDGYTPQSCSRCSATQNIDVVAALGHTYGDPEYVAATTDVEAYWTATCETCGEAITLTSGIGFTFYVSDEAMLKSAATLDGATIVLTVEETTTPLDGSDGDDDEEFAADIELTSTLTIDKDITLDLNGHTLGYPEPAEEEVEEEEDDDDEEEPEEEVETESATSDDVITVTESGSLTITDGTAKNENEYGFTYGTGAVVCTYPTANSANNKAAIRTAGEVVIESGIVYSTSVGIHAIAGSVTINDGVVYDTSYYVMWEGDGEVDVTINGGIVAGAKSGILVDGDSNFGHVGTAESPNGYQYGAVNTLTVTGGEVYSGGASQPAIRTELQSGPDTAIIKISDGKIICDVDTARTERMCAVFLANGTLTISGGYIEGPTALEIHAGKATISGGTFVATGNGQAKNITGSDPYSYGYALAIIATGNIARNNHDSDYFPDMTVDVDVTGGTYDGGIYVSAETVCYYNTDSKTSILVSNMTEEQRIQYADYIWAVSFERDATGGTTQKYVVTIDDSLELTRVAYTADGEIASDDDTVDHYGYTLCKTAGHDCEGHYDTTTSTWTYTCIECGAIIDKSDVASGTVLVHHVNMIASTTEALFSAIEENNFWNQYLV